ncbi:MAG: peptidase U32 family protein, partial [Pseudomonadota bacterium]
MSNKNIPQKIPELLSPAGDRQCALAAFQYGADAIYLGAKEFSARHDAVNFTLEEIEEIIAYAHSLLPRRRVFITVNTLIKNREINGIIKLLGQLQEMAADAFIIQDLGIFHLAKNFSQVECHASTQLVAHDLPGAMALRDLGFKSITLARELTLAEIAQISQAGIETEVFVHGALCYSYSGLCPYSSHQSGRS